MELNFYKKGKSLLNGSLEFLLFFKNGFINDFRLFGIKVSHSFSFKLTCQLRNHDIGQFIHFHHGRGNNGFSLMIKGFLGFDRILDLIRLMKHK